MRILGLALLGLLSTATIHSASADGLVSAILPTGRSGIVNPSFSASGIATVFATVINTSGKNLTQCKLDQSRYIAGLSGVSYSYTLTDPATNRSTGVTSPFSLAAGAGQTMVIGINATSSVASTMIRPSFVCTDPVTGLGYDALSTDGLNTIQYSASAQQPPDVVALSGTVSGDGVVRIVGNGGAPFVVAVSNVGAAGTITASVDTGTVTLPLQASICQTNPATSQCLHPPATSTSLSLAAKATATFSIFVYANGELPLRPDANRIFVRFTDSNNTPRGGTSVAVTNTPALDRSQPIGGIYATKTPYFDQLTGTTSVTNGVLYVAENGQFQGFDELGGQTGGTLSVGADLSVSGTSADYLYASEGYVAAGSHPTTWSGTLSQKNSIYIQRAQTFPQTGVTSYLRDSQELYGNAAITDYVQASSLALVAGTWNIRDNSDNVGGSITIAANGSYSGAISTCAINGTVGLIDTRYDVYTMQLNLPGCPVGSLRATSLTGLAVLVTYLTKNDTLSFIGNNPGKLVGSVARLTRY